MALTRTSGVGLFIAASSLLGGCGGSVPLAPSGPHPIHVQEFKEVEYPPPPAQVEEIPKEFSDGSDCVWVDGHWDWANGKWVWEKGKWVIMPEDCYRAPPLVAWSKTREPKLYYSPPHFYRTDAANLPEAKASCPTVPRVCGALNSAE